MKKFFAAVLVLICMPVFAAEMIILFKDGRQMSFDTERIKAVVFSDTQAGGELDISGVWNNDVAEPITFLQNGNGVAGRYSPDNGEITGTMSGNVLNGFWIENSSNRQCAYPINGRYYWGKIQMVFSGNSFKGRWGYCEDEPSSPWNGTRRQ